MDISFKLDPETIIGSDTLSRAGTISGAYGSRALIITGQTSIERLKGILEDSRIDAIVFDEMPARPVAGAVTNAAGLCRGARCSMVIGFGGLDVQLIARMTAIISASEQSVFDLLDGCRAGPDFLPYIAIPTTGADPFIFSHYCITVDPRDGLIRRVQSPDRLCVAAIIDSGLLAAQPDSAATFDGLCAAVEAYCSTKANPLSDALLERAIALYARLIRSGADSADFDAAAASATAGYLAAMGIAASAPGIGLALSYAISGRFEISVAHCAAILLPHIAERLVAARPEKMAKVAALMGETSEGSPVSDAANLVPESLRRRMAELAIPSCLQDCKLSLDRLATVAEAARNLEFVAFSPWTVSAEDVFELLKRAF